MRSTIFDGFKNLLKSFGGDNDTRTQTMYVRTPRISNLWDFLEDLYTTSWIAGKVVDIPVNDAFKEGRTLNIENKAKKEEVEEIYKSLDKKIKLGLKFARVYGGAVLIIVSTDDELDQPISNFSKGDLINLAVLGRSQLVPQGIDRNPLSVTYLQPTSYIIVNTTQTIDPSRIIYLDGVTTTNYERELNNGFGSSIYERGFKNIEDAVQTNVALRNLVEQSNVDVVKMDGLNKAVASNAEAAAKERIQILSQMKSVLNTVAIDGKDDYVNISKNFGTLDKIQMNMFLIICGAFDIPFTRFMGKSAEGLSATGDGDLTNYYDAVKADIQIDRLEEIYKILDPLVTMHLYGSDEGFTYEFNPLYTLTEKEEADIRNVNAQVRASDLDRGVIDEETALTEAQKDGLYVNAEIGYTEPTFKV